MRRRRRRTVDHPVINTDSRWTRWGPMWRFKAVLCHVPYPHVYEDAVSEFVHIAETRRRRTYEPPSHVIGRTLRLITLISWGTQIRLAFTNGRRCDRRVPFIDPATVVVHTFIHIYTWVERVIIRRDPSQPRNYLSKRNWFSWLGRVAFHKTCICHESWHFETKTYQLRDGGLIRQIFRPIDKNRNTFVDNFTCHRVSVLWRTWALILFRNSVVKAYSRVGVLFKGCTTRHVPVIRKAF